MKTKLFLTVNIIRRRKKLKALIEIRFLSFLFIIITCFIWAQTGMSQTIEFEYDEAGNRVQRTLVFTEEENDLVEASNASISNTFLQVEPTILPSGIADTKVYPNPTMGLVYIRFDEEAELANISIVIKSMLGNEVMRIDDIQRLNEIDLGHLNSGVYLLTIQSDQAQQTQKIIKH